MHWLWNISVSTHCFYPLCSFLFENKTKQNKIFKRLIQSVHFGVGITTAFEMAKALSDKNRCILIFLLYFLISFSFLKLYSIDYAITVVPVFPLCPCPLSTPHSLRQSSHIRSCPWVVHISSLATAFPMLYFTSP